MQVTYRPYKPASDFRGSASLEVTQSRQHEISHTRQNGLINLLLIVSQLSNDERFWHLEPSKLL
jgi:hypothetical protein